MIEKSSMDSRNIIVLSLMRILFPLISTREEELIYENIKKIERIDGNFSFVVLGDNKNSISTFGNIIEKINEDPEVAFVINTGDMVFDGSLVKYSFYISQISKLKVPILPVEIMIWKIMVWKII